MQSFQVW